MAASSSSGSGLGDACKHHAQLGVCESRAKYREGRRPRAVKVGPAWAFGGPGPRPPPGRLRREGGRALLEGPRRGSAVPERDPSGPAPAPAPAPAPTPERSVLRAGGRRWSGRGVVGCGSSAAGSKAGELPPFLRLQLGRRLDCRPCWRLSPVLGVSPFLFSPCRRGAAGRGRRQAAGAGRHSWRWVW